MAYISEKIREARLRRLGHAYRNTDEENTEEGSQWTPKDRNNKTETLYKKPCMQPLTGVQREDEQDRGIWMTKTSCDDPK